MRIDAKQRPATKVTKATKVSFVAFCVLGGELAGWLGSLRDENRMADLKP